MIKFPPRKILVAYDPSDASRTAWRHASALAARGGAALEVVFVLPFPTGVDLVPPAGMITADERAYRTRIRKVVGDLKLTILHGDPAARILDYARDRRPDLLVVGSNGRRGFERLIIGSVAEAVIRGSEIPVLVARGRVRPVRGILAPVNFTRYSEHGFLYAGAAAAALRARLKAVHVTGDAAWSGNIQFRLSRLFDRLPPRIRARCRPEAAAVEGEAVDGILKAARGQDWIVLVAHRKSLIGDAFFGTTVQQVLRSSPIPVLSVPAAGVPDEGRRGRPVSPARASRTRSARGARQAPSARAAAPRTR